MVDTSTARSVTSSDSIWENLLKPEGGVGLKQNGRDSAIIYPECKMKTHTDSEITSLSNCSIRFRWVICIDVLIPGNESVQSRIPYLDHEQHITHNPTARLICVIESVWLDDRNALSLNYQARQGRQWSRELWYHVMPKIFDLTPHSIIISSSVSARQSYTASSQFKQLPFSLRSKI